MKMTKEEAITQLEYEMAMCLFNPITGEEGPLNEDCRKLAEALKIAIQALKEQIADTSSCTHELKILPKWFEDVISNRKNFEIRRNDRDFKVGDFLLLREYERGKYVGGSLDFEGVVTIENGTAMVTYLDIGEEESFPMSQFPVAGRKIWSDEWARDYWRTLHLGGEPPEKLWKKELYRQEKE